MKKNRNLIILCSFALICATLNAQEGIHFQKTEWSEIKAKAISENKLIFADIYTQWCGPCLNMAQKVFPLYSVGTFYNQHFINAKIDAENGEGVALAKKYNVQSYPTYLFIDPKTEEVVHSALGSQSPEDFIYIGKSAFDPKLRSTFLESQNEQGVDSPEFLMDYAAYQGIAFKRDAVLKTMEKLVSINGYNMENPKVWAIFTKYVRGRTNPLFDEFYNNLDKYRNLYGQEAVNEKLNKEFAYVENIEELENSVPFEGKNFLLFRNKLNTALRAKDYTAAIAFTDSLLNLPKEYLSKVCNALTFVCGSNTYGEHPLIWHEKCLEMAQYIAYNNPDRDEARVHFLYAQQLELAMKRLNKPVDAPKIGTQDYNMRPVDLKPKPKK